MASLRPQAAAAGTRRGARLRRHALALAHEPLDTRCDQLPARMPPGSTDDVALLALRLPSL